MEKGRPVDQGYSWIILACAAAINYFVAGTFGTMSILLVELLHVYPNGKVLLAWTTGLHVSIGYITSVPISWCIIKCGRRFIGFTSALLLSMAFVLSAVVRDPLCLLIGIGCVGGVSAGFLYNISILSVQKYFVKKWLTSQGIVFSSLSLGFLTYPLLMRILIDEHAWCGAMLLHGGLLLHILPCCLLLKKPKRHKYKQDKEIIFGSTENQQRTQEFECNSRANHNATGYSLASMISPITRHPSTLICLTAIMITQSGSVIPVLITPLMADQIGASKFQGALLLSVAAAISFVCRTLFGYTGDKKWLNQKVICGISGILGGTLSISICFINSYETLAALVACISIPSSLFMSTWAAALTDKVDSKQVPLALGYGTMSLGLGDMSTLGITGIMLENRGNVRLTFMVFGFAEILGGLIFILMFVYKKIQEQNCKPTHEDTICTT